MGREGAPNAARRNAFMSLLSDTGRLGQAYGGSAEFFRVNRGGTRAASLQHPPGAMHWELTVLPGGFSLAPRWLQDTYLLHRSWGKKKRKKRLLKAKS